MIINLLGAFEFYNSIESMYTTCKQTAGLKTTAYPVHTLCNILQHLLYNVNTGGTLGLRKNFKSHHLGSGRAG